jgi:zinc/manganese transport system substrate-binding protein
VVLPFTVGGNERASDLFGLFDSSVELLRGAAK